MIYIWVVALGSLLFFGFFWYLLSASLLHFVNQILDMYPSTSWFPEHVVNFTTAVITYLSVLFMFVIVIWVIKNSEKLGGYPYAR